MSDERIIRLVGDGENEMSGGGLMLPDAFAAPLQYLLDIPGQAPWELLVKKIMEVMSKKENRILAIWGSWDSFGEDILLQLGSKNLIRVESLHSEGKKFFCSLPDDFIPGHEYEVISIEGITSARQGKHSPDRAETVIAYDGKTREKRNVTDALLAGLTGWKVKVQRAGRMTSALSGLLEQVALEVEGTKDVKGRPPKPPDEPGVLRECQGACGKWKPKTKANWVIYWSRDQWYWRPSCKECLASPRTKAFQAKLSGIIVDFMKEHDGEVPTSQEAWEAMGESAKRVVQKSWDRIAERGELPYRKD